MPRFDVLTIFPGFFDGPLRYGMVRRAISTGAAEVHLHDLRQWTSDRHQTVDDRPFGGGEGMVMKPEPFFAAAEALAITPKAARDRARETVLLLSAQGRPFTQPLARELASTERIVLLCGRYEGVDERVAEGLCDREISIGDYVLSGGELAAAVLIDAVLRLLPGVLGNSDSAQYESFGAADSELSRPAAPGETPAAIHGTGGLLDYPHYTRPAAFAGKDVPAELLSGDHLAIRRWRRQQSLRKTLRNRPDLLERAALSPADRAILDQIRREENLIPL